MKKWLIYLCVSAIALNMAACGSRENGADSSAESGAGQSSPAQESGAGSAADNEGGADGTDAENDSLSGAEDGSWSEEMSALREAVAAELGDQYWPDMPIPAEMLEMTYGLTADMYEDYMGETPMISAQVDTLLIVKPAEGQADAVEQALDNYRTNLVENSLQYPMNLGKVQASTVERAGDYVCFVLMGGAMEGVDEDDEEAQIAYCREVNQSVLDLISETAAQ